MGVTITLTDDATAATGQSLSGVYGSETGAVAFHVWADQGVAGGYYPNIALRPVVEDPNNPGTWLFEGHKALDGKWFQIRRTGSSNPSSVAGLDQQTADWQPCGTAAPFYLNPLYGNTAAHIEVKVVPQAEQGSPDLTFSWRLILDPDAVVYGIASGVCDTLSGILSGCGDARLCEFVTAPLITATGTPDAQVHVSAGDWLDFGTHRYRGAVTDLTLNQNDSAAAALASGQSYYAVISQPLSGGAAVATKGLKGTSPTVPSMPSDSLYIGYVRVVYQAGGTSVISTSNITQVATNGRAITTASTGLTVVAGRLRGLIGGAMIRNGGTQTIALGASVTTRLWIPAGGGVLLRATDDRPPVSGAQRLADVVTDGSSVTSVTDRRRIVRPGAIVATLAQSGNETAATGVATFRVPWDCVIDELALSVDVAAAGGATGVTTCDVNYTRAGATATLFGDAAGRLSLTAGSFVTKVGYPTVSVLKAGDTLTLDVDAITTGGTLATNVTVALTLVPG